MILSCIEQTFVQNIHKISKTQWQEETLVYE